MSNWDNAPFLGDTPFFIVGMLSIRIARYIRIIWPGPKHTLIVSVDCMYIGYLKACAWIHLRL